MKNLSLTLLFFSVCFFSKAQDSTKAINHEIGFNTVLLIKQVLSDNPTSALPQLPYAIFYNLYFKDKAGIRLGLGYFSSNTKTSVEGQLNPRETTQNSMDLRAGYSYNFVRSNRLTFNAFIDGLYGSHLFKTVNTGTMQVGPSGTATISTTSSDDLSRVGAQVGVGIKYNLHKHVSVYAELPVSVASETTRSEIVSTRTGTPPIIDKSKTTGTSVRITLPTTIYLVLRF